MSTAEPFARVYIYVWESCCCIVSRLYTYPHMSRRVRVIVIMLCVVVVSDAMCGVAVFCGVYQQHAILLASDRFPLLSRVPPPSPLPPLCNDRSTADTIFSFYTLTTNICYTADRVPGSYMRTFCCCRWTVGRWLVLFGGGCNAPSTYIHIYV